MSAPEMRNFEPKEPVVLAPPKSDPIPASYLAKCNGSYPPSFSLLHGGAD